MNQSTYLNRYIRPQQSDLATARLSSRLMRDAGISEAERFVEATKPFWRA